MSDEINPTSASAESSSEAKEEITPAEPISAPEPIQTPESEPQTAHPALDEPLDPKPENPVSEPVEAEIHASRNQMSELKAKAELATQDRKRKKLDRIMTLFDPSTGSGQVTNDEVEKLLHTSDATATRYLSILEKEGKIQQNGKTGKGVFYVKINS